METAGQKVDLTKHGLGDRAEYVQDLKDLANLQVKETPIYGGVEEDETETNSSAEEFENQLASKYTTHLYAQWEPIVDEPWTRLYGDNAFKTMSAIIDEGGFEAGGTVVLASLEGYWDALTAAGIAGLEGAPVVMSLPEGLSPEETMAAAEAAAKGAAE